MAITVRLPLLISRDGNFQFKNSEIQLNSISEISLTLLKDFKLKLSDFYLIKRAENFYNVKLRLLGGKGGFGSQLRAQGNKMSSKKRAGNYESCRSLNGQRLRVQKQTKMIEEYLAREPERLSKREKEIREKMQKHLEAPGKKLMFYDPNYLKISKKLGDETEDAVRNGLKAKINLESDDFNSYSDFDEKSLVTDTDTETETEIEEIDQLNEDEDCESIESNKNIANEKEKESTNLNARYKGASVKPEFQTFNKSKNNLTTKYLDKYLKK